MRTSSRKPRAVAGAIAIAAATAGCGLGPGSSTGAEATLTVTRDYGHERLLEAVDSDLSESDTVMRFLDREAEIETRYGGGFVQSIDGISGGVEGGRSHDWFFYVNGIESPVGAAEVNVRDGDRIWWDHRDWTDAMRVPAVVGSWPEPFLNGADGAPVEVDCRAAEATCATVEERLSDAGVEVGKGEGPTVLVGSWRRVRIDAVVEQVENGPGVSGVFATFQSREAGPPAVAPFEPTSVHNSPDEGYDIMVLDAHADAVRTLGASTGLIAAVRSGDDPPVWLVTGTDDAGVLRAAEALGESSLRNRYAVAVTRRGATLALPSPEGHG